MLLSLFRSHAVLDLGLLALLLAVFDEMIAEKLVNEGLFLIFRKREMVQNPLVDGMIFCDVLS